MLRGKAGTEGVRRDLISVGNNPGLVGNNPVPMGKNPSFAAFISI
jgi:hypothetical protein